MRLEGKRVVITGGGRGIGAAAARALAVEGAMVVVSARSRDQIESVARKLLDDGYQAGAIACNVTDEADVARLVRQAEEFLGGVDILINNAGIAASAPVHKIELADWERIFAVNVTGTFLCTRGFLPSMVRRGWGRVVNVASVAGKMGAPYISAYTASKHAVIGFTRAVAMEVATKGVTINAVCPGYVDTEMAQQAIDKITSTTELTAEGARESLRAMSPQRRLFEVGEVAYQILSLCDPRAKGINGQSIVLDGGQFQT